MKRKGFAMISTIVAVIAWFFVSLGIFVSISSEFQGLAASDLANEAKMLALLDSHLLHNVDFDNATSASALSKAGLHTGRGTINNADASGWDDEIVIGPLQSGSGGQYRIATVNIYKKGESTPTVTMEVPISPRSDYYNKAQIDEILKDYYTRDEAQSKFNEVSVIVSDLDSKLSAKKPCHDGCCETTGEGGEGDHEPGMGDQNSDGSGGSP